MLGKSRKVLRSCGEDSESSSGGSTGGEELCDGTVDRNPEMDWKKVLLKGLDFLDLSPTTEQVEQFRIYRQELLKWNRATRLISREDEKRFVTQHVLPSLVILRFIPGDVVELADVGSGGGLPGIPLKIMRPGLRVTLIEAKLKKVFFLREVVEKLRLFDTHVLNKRAEELKCCYPLVVTRAVGKLRKVVRTCLPLLGHKGTLIVFKGSEKDGEMEVARPWIKKYGGEVRKVRKIVFPVTGKRGRLIFLSNVSRETS